MLATLVIITFMGGASWGPQVTSMQVPGAEICKGAKGAVATLIARTAQNNFVGVIQVTHEGRDTVVTVSSGRQIARLSCVNFAAAD